MVILEQPPVLRVLWRSLARHQSRWSSGPLPADLAVRVLCRPSLPSSPLVQAACQRQVCAKSLGKLQKVCTCFLQHWKAV